MVERLELLLKTKNLSASQLADETGIQRSIMSHVMNGRNKASLDFIMRILKRYKDVNPDWLLFGKGPMIKDNTLFDNEENSQLEELKKENQELKKQITQLNQKIYKLDAEKTDHQKESGLKEADQQSPPGAETLNDEEWPGYGKPRHVNRQVVTVITLFNDGAFREYHRDS